MTHAYPRGLRGPALHDVMLVFAWFVALFVIDVAQVRLMLLVAIPLVLAWGIVTLHFPSRVAIDDAGVTFFHYGRAHRFAWSEVTRVRVRRFAMRDRVLVRIDPSDALRGRYWLLDSIRDFDTLVTALEARARPGA
jgi:hypothetical protein